MSINSFVPVVSLAACLFWVVPAPAQTKGSDLLEQYKKQQEIAAQKAESDVNAAVNEAQRLLAADPAQSVDTLRKALTRLEADTALSAARREALARMLRDRIRGGQVEADKATARGEPKVSQAAAKAAAERQAADQEKVNRTLQSIQVLQREGKNAEAARLADDLLKQYPNQLASQANTRITSTTDVLAAARNNRADAGGRNVATLIGVDRSAMPPRGDVDFPPDWKERVAKRTTLNGPQLTSTEKAIMKALATPISVNYKDARLEDIIQDLSDKLGQPILLDRTSLQEAQVTTDSPSSLTIKNAASRSVLRKVLGDLGLTYIVKNEAIQVITPERAAKEMTVKTYYIGDLLQGGMFAQSGIRFNPWLDQIQAMQNVMSIIQMVETIDPGSWQKNGGQGSITFNVAAMALVIKQTAELHNMLGGSLR